MIKKQDLFFSVGLKGNSVKGGRKNSGGKVDELLRFYHCAIIKAFVGWKGELLTDLKVKEDEQTETT
ncbi:hypothetical protein MKZ02_07310 [Pseudobacillus sp. FSL P4-0506]|uniref:hypothetical protein n=1 Tax=unclassified Pseudobacillus TaxID=2619284 RepID=UPI0030FD0DD7